MRRLALACSRRMQGAPLCPNGGIFPPSRLGPVSSPSRKNCQGFSSATLLLLCLPVLLLLLALLRFASAHPQCLDFEPPFKPQWHLEFCTLYQDFGCCDQETDNSIAERYWDIIDQLELEGLVLCEDTLKEIMCQVRVHGCWSVVS